MFTGQAASAKYSLLNHMYRKDSCQCTDRMCWKLECPSNDRHSICYVGPCKAKLKVYTEGDKCTYIVHPFPKYDRVSLWIGPPSRPLKVMVTLLGII